MSAIPTRDEQIRQTHAQLIVLTVKAVQNTDQRPGLEEALQLSEANGWAALVTAIRGILAGRRDAALLNPLDEEDRVIVEAILEGLQDPTRLPDPNAPADPLAAAPGLANLIHAASRGDQGALSLLADMAEQMTQGPGDMARLGGLMRRMVEGERDADRLTEGMGASGRDLVYALLAELGKREAH